ncbi:MAG TPA: polymer-forming cytoskeletal protein [Chitinophagales bacterium]|nr:polymer-forming cytoskeletal protein [Chitinophagales bacterium]HRK26667.1 polymer-forming cytoskeletal protein [Chitinophagales bacterium]
MFGSSKKASEEKPPLRRDGGNALNIIGQGTKITGAISCQGDIRIDGEVQGNITAYAKIVIGSSGMVLGDIVCENADVAGKIDGTIKVKELLNLKETATITGDISTHKLVIEAGAVFNGLCTMNNAETFNFDLPNPDKTHRYAGNASSKSAKSTA